MKITYMQLYNLKACEDQLALFHTLFGDEVELTEEIVLTHGSKFSIEWAVMNLLPKGSWDKFETARAPASEKVTVHTWADYKMAKVYAFWQIAQTLD